MKHCLPMLALLLLPITGLMAQLFEVSLEQKVAGSTLIVEGVVEDQQSFWNEKRTMIYTANKVAVYKTFKGEWRKSYLEVMTVGGSVGLDAVFVEHLGDLSIGETAMFLLSDPWNGMKDPANGEPLWQLTAGEQGVLSYDLLSNQATTPFAKYDGITTTLYKAIQSQTGAAFVDIGSRDLDKMMQALQVPAIQSANITSFSPSVVTGGTLLDPANNVLTITGTNLISIALNSNHKVLFKDADNDNNRPSFAIVHSDPHVISWTSEQIRIRVPARAGTGQIAVTKAIGDTIFSAGNLTVPYAVQTANFGGIGLREPRLAATNGAGGYNILYSTSSAGSGANIVNSAVYPSVLRAIATWKVSGGANLVEAGNTQIQSVTEDGSNVIMLDNNNTGVPVLPDGVLGVCYSFFSTCNSSTTAFKAGFDVVIRNAGVSLGSQNFENGPCAPKLENPPRQDMETVLLHELGHALNLAHVNDPTEVPTETNFNFINFANPSGLMHYTITPWLPRRSLDAFALSGLNYTMTNIAGTNFGICRASGVFTASGNLRPANDGCPIAFPLGNTPPGTAFNISTLHATSSKDVDAPFTRYVQGQPSFGIGVTNNVYEVIRTTSSGQLTLTVSNYLTEPGGVANDCNEDAVGQGVLVTIFVANACPTPATYPNPVVTLLVTENETFAINGFPAQSLPLLMVFNGYRGTKASFTMTVGGTALPITVASFEGRKLQTGTNELTAVISTSENVREVVLQRSNDGLTFEHLTPLKPDATGSFVGRHVLLDEAPPKAVNYYRLKATDKNGEVSQSVMVVLDNRVHGGAITVTPNPINNFLMINNLPPTTKEVIATMVDMNGRRVISKQLGRLGGTHTIATGQLPIGFYMVQVVDGDGEVYLQQKVMKH